MARRLREHRLATEPVERLSGYEPSRAIPPLRRGYYFVEDRSIVGDAPKKFIRVYEYGEGRRDRPGSWPAYIAKVGHKWYPNESITEHLLTWIGESLGFRMARSRLMRAHGQIRYLSRMFLDEGQEMLVHGSEVFSRHLQDTDFVAEVDKKRLAGTVFDFQVTCEAIRGLFQADAETILDDFVRMLVFDALVGNHDRHINNWGVIIHVKGRESPRLAPIYDTARGLLWNHPEDALAKRWRTLSRYVEDSRPQIGWQGQKLEITLISSAALQKSTRATGEFCPRMARRMLLLVCESCWRRNFLS